MRKLNLLIKYFHYLGTVSFLSYLVQRFIKKSRLLAIKVPNLLNKVLIRNLPNDIQVFTQIFINQEYALEMDEDVNTIIDCGANIGLASLFFLSKFPNARIIAIEPERNNFDLLKQNLQFFPGVTCINKGVWNRNAILEITNYSRGEAGFIVSETQQKSDKSIPATSISEIIEEFGFKEIQILKIDIEGSEEQVFQDEPQWLDQVKMIFCEIHENMKPGLTQKIRSMLSLQFICSVQGEYNVFVRTDDSVNSSN
jgi:FkbM family methyltransferase